MLSASWPVDRLSEHVHHRKTSAAVDESHTCHRANLPKARELHQTHVVGAPYEYSTLAHHDSIRIVELFPSKTQESPLQSELVHTRLSDGFDGSNGYTALSYVWGIVKESHPLQIGNKCLLIGANLDAALRHLRRHDRPIRVWADAICINQLDISERNHQVRQMRSIYSSARDTVIYLGNQDGGNIGYSAWNFLERNSEWAMNQNRDVDYGLPVARENMNHFRGDLADVESDILNRAWFRRVWVFQEVVVSQNLFIQSGDRRISWDDFSRILLLSPRYHDQYGNSLGWRDKIEVVRDMFHTRCSYLASHSHIYTRPDWHSRVESYKGTDLQILNVLERARHLQASDPRDKIFALLGISTGVNLKRFVIDYGKSRNAVYLDFARHLMETTNSHDLLSHVDDSEDDVDLEAWKRTSILTESVPKLPSWVPNWDRGKDKAQKYSRTILSTLEEESHTARQQRQLLVSTSRAWIWMPSTDRLVVLGTVLGVVFHTGPEITVYGNDELEFQALRQRYLNDPVKLQEEILRCWGRLFNRNRILDSRLLPKFYPFGDLVSMKINPPKNSVEYHLLSRARKTVTWSDENNLAVTVITDKGSIVDGRRIAAYVLRKRSLLTRLSRLSKRLLALPASPADQGQGLAILPNTAKTGDFIVNFNGGRIPFVVRKLEGDSYDFSVGAWRREIKDQGIHANFNILNCKLVGECLANGLNGLALSKDADCTFIMK